MSLEHDFDPTFVAALAVREKQIQQNYRPIIGIHKWFARRPGTVFRNLLLAEFNGDEPLETAFWRAHELQGLIADPFMGGGTPIYEANRLGLNVVGTDINPMAYWIVRQSLSPLDIEAFSTAATEAAIDVELEIGDLYLTRCVNCGSDTEVKYFLWVKTQACPLCGTENDLFPGYLLAEATRHPKHVLACAHCGALNECARQPSRMHPEACAECGQPVHVEGPARRNQVRCRTCSHIFAYPHRPQKGAPVHRMWAIEYHCHRCKSGYSGRFFKRPDAQDLKRFDEAERRLLAFEGELPIPDDAIPLGDETLRLHRWGYQQYREMFNRRQLLGLGLLLGRIMEVAEAEIRHALLTVFSDFLRYQNMLCRYDTYALKCQDIFSVHGFPVGLIQCENNLLGIPSVGSGSFRHFVEKYRRAKEYCESPYETRQTGKRKQIVPIEGERLEAQIVDAVPDRGIRQAFLSSSPASEIKLPPASLDGVFTDPPYFDNVQYAELMDFCFAWLRIGLSSEFPAFRGSTTRSIDELTGNSTLGRGIEHFTLGLSDVFCRYSAALKPGAPFVFTYHHNDPLAYVPIVVAILDAGLVCTAALPAPAEMGASLHIARSNSSVLDTIFVCRGGTAVGDQAALDIALHRDIKALEAAGLRMSDGDMRCLSAGHCARLAVNVLRPSWKSGVPLSARLALARTELLRFADGSGGGNVTRNGVRAGQSEAGIAEAIRG